MRKEHPDTASLASGVAMSFMGAAPPSQSHEQLVTLPWLLVKAASSFEGCQTRDDIKQAQNSRKLSGL